jgi:PAS domain S-box-containing protein
MHQSTLGSTELLRILDSGVVGVAVWDRTGRIHEANERFLALVGHDREDMESGFLDMSRLTLGKWEACAADLMDRLGRHGIARAVDQEYRRKDGTRIFVKLHSATLSAAPARMLSIVVDVTEQKRAEQERDALVEREQLARAVAESAVRARDDILAIVSHDLRNPLNIVAMSADLLGEPIPEEKKAAQLGIMRRAIAGMKGLIADLLDVSQIASERFAVVPAPIDVASLVEEARSMFEPLLAKKSQGLDCAVPPQPIMVLADWRRVNQVLSNLIGNANKFTPEGGRISLEVALVEGWARFAVADTGPGIGRHDLPHIFDRFWQARQVRRGGVGLGLAICKGIVEAHGGRLWAESSAGMGTTFFFTLPRARAPSPC